jgi:hypothetical protein
MMIAGDQKLICLILLIGLVSLGGCDRAGGRQRTPDSATPTVNSESGSGIWMGPPSYSVDANSPSLFRLEYESDRWELSPYHSGDKLVHRSIAGCEIVPTIGSELPEGYSVEHETKLIGGISYGANLAYESGQLQYATYFTQVGKLQTGFLVWNVDLCIQEAEVVLATLQAVDNPSYSP